MLALLLVTSVGSKRYAQWRAWMRILETLRQIYPDIVMDHRQTAHAWYTKEQEDKEKGKKKMEKMEKE